MENWIESTVNYITHGPDWENKLLGSLAILFIILVLHFIAQRVIKRRVEDVRARYRWRKVITYAAVALAILLVIPIWFRGLGSMATFLGLVSAGLAIALTQPITNLAGWLFILWRRPFRVGDRIQIGEHIGDVIDQRIFQFALLESANWVAADESTGRMIYVPNGKVFSDVLANFTIGFEYIWDEIPVLITFESDWEKAKSILKAIAVNRAADLTKAAAEEVTEVAREYMIFFPTLDPRVYTSVENSGVLLTIRYICEPKKRRIKYEVIWEDILRAFAQHSDINFAYPTQRFYQPGTNRSAATGTAMGEANHMRAEGEPGP